MTVGNKKKRDLLAEIFIGEYVEIVQAHSRNNPIVIHGYILDIDEDNIYLGETPDAVNMTILRNGYKLMVIVNPEDVLLNNMETPNKNEVN